LSSTASVSTAHGLVVGADGSESSSLALEFAATEARVRSLPLEVVNTWECLTTYGGTYPDFNPKGVAPAYGVYRETDGTSERALFVLDVDHVISWSFLSPIGVSPGVDGALRAVQALS